MNTTKDRLILHGFNRQACRAKAKSQMPICACHLVEPWMIGWVLRVCFRPPPYVSSCYPTYLLFRDTPFLLSTPGPSPRLFVLP